MIQWDLTVAIIYTICMYEHPISPGHGNSTCWSSPWVWCKWWLGEPWTGDTRDVSPHTPSGWQYYSYSSDTSSTRCGQPGEDAEPYKPSRIQTCQGAYWITINDWSQNCVQMVWGFYQILPMQSEVFNLSRMKQSLRLLDLQLPLNAPMVAICLLDPRPSRPARCLYDVVHDLTTSVQLLPGEVGGSCKVPGASHVHTQEKEGGFESARVGGWRVPEASQSWNGEVADDLQFRQGQVFRANHVIYNQFELKL